MSWPGFALRYRYTVFAALIAVAVFGVTARFELPIKLFPDSDPAVVTVITSHPGVAAGDVAKNVSKVMEEEFSGIDGVRRVSSTSQTGLSVVKVEFDYERDVSDAALDVQNAISRIRTALPGGIKEPQVLEFSSSDRPIITAALTGDGLSLPEVRTLADNAVRDRLQLVPGVAAVDVFGGYTRRLEVAVDRFAMHSHGISLAAVERVLGGWNLTEPGGRVERGDLEALVRFDAPLSSPEQVARLAVARQGDRVVRLGDIATVRLAQTERRSSYRYNGEPAIAVQILKRDAANTVEVAARVRGVLDELRTEFPKVAFRMADDDSEFTELVISNMTTTVFTAIGLTIVVVLLFLGHFRQAAIIALSIPVAFLMTFALMQMAGLELNMITMSAIILSIGLLVDDGIVVLENVHRHLLEGLSPPQAALRGTEEIFLADLAGTVTTISVLVPLMFLGGFVGRLFEPLAWTLGFALASSFVVSVTLIPLLTALWLKPGDDSQGPVARWTAPFTTAIDRLKVIYLNLLARALRHPVKTLLTAIAILLVSVRLMAMLGSEMLPKFDAGNFRVLVDTIPGTTLEETSEAIETVESILLAEREVVAVSTQLGFEPGVHYLGSRGAMDVNQAEITVNMTPRNEREESVWDVMGRAREAMRDIPGVTLAILKEKGGTARATTTSPIDVRITGPDSEILDRLGDEVINRLHGVPGLTNLYKNWGIDTPELRVDINAERASELGLTGRDVARAVYNAVEGRIVTPYRRDTERDLDVFLRYRQADRTSLTDLENVYITAPSGNQVALRELAALRTELGPRLITRENLSRTLNVLGHHYGRPLSDAVADVEAVIARIDTPPGYSLQLGGEQTDFEEARARMMRALALGIVAVYLVLVAQFRSFKHPFTIMMAVPLQFIGVALALILAGKYLSMPALLGIILLTGTVVNNSIVLIDYILVRLSEGMVLDEAIMESVSVRYRPIMMTAVSDIAGMLPLAMEMAVGAERFSPIATVIIGGIIAATLLTLVIIPALFSLIERRVGRVRASDQRLLPVPD